jgi:hypothetical protein
MILNSMTGYWMRFTPDQAAAMTKPYAGGIEAWEVGPVVGNVRNNRPDLMDRVRLLYACNVRFASEVGHWCSPKASQGRRWNKLPGEVRGHCSVRSADHSHGEPHAVQAPKTLPSIMVRRLTGQRAPNPNAQRQAD